MRLHTNLFTGAPAHSCSLRTSRHLGQTLQQRAEPSRQIAGRRLLCQARGEELTDTIKIKHREISALIKELGQDVVEQRIVDAQDTPIQPQFQLVSRIISVKEIQCRPAVILEISRQSPASTREELVEEAKQYDKMGADILCLKASAWNDWAKTLQDVFAISRAVKLPLLLRDIFLHPVQVVDAKQAGAAGILGLITAVTAQGTPILSSFACSLGMDAPVEVVNLAELKPMMSAGAAVFGINISVGMSLGIAGARMSTAAGILRELPHDCMAVVGIQDLEEAKQAADNGAHALLIKASLFRDQAKLDHDADEVVRELMYQLSGDD